MNVTAGLLAMSVSDDGCGGASLANSRGLRGLADRIEVAGGVLSVVSPPGGPTRMALRYQLPDTPRWRRISRPGYQNEVNRLGYCQ